MAALVGTAAAMLLVMPQLKFLALHQSFYDLGQYATAIHALAFGGEGGQLLQGHAHLLAPLYAAAWRLYPSPATLLALQSVALLGSLWLAGFLFQRAGAGSVLDGALLLALAFPLWFAALFEFHFEHLVFPLVFGATLALLSGRTRGRTVFLLCAIVLCFVKEAYALTAMALGLWAALFRRERLLGAITVAVGGAWFVAASVAVIPFYSRGLQSGAIWASAFGSLGNTVSEMAWTLLSHPLDTLRLVAEPRKLVYAGALATLFGYAWLRRPAAALVALPALGLSLVSANPNHVYLGNQYTAAVAAPLFVATAFGLAAMRPDPRLWAKRTAVAMAAGTLVLFGPSPASRLFLQDTTFAYGASAFQMSERDRRIAATLDRIIPADPSVPVAVQNNLVTPRLAARRALMPFPAGTETPFRLLAPVRGGMIASMLRAFGGGAPARSDDLFAAFVVLDDRRPRDLFDQGCDFRKGACRDPDAVRRFEAAMAGLAGAYEPILDEDGLRVFRRRPPPTTANAPDTPPDPAPLAPATPDGAVP